jgi:predicted secreted protein
MGNMNGFDSDEQEQYYLEIERQKFEQEQYQQEQYQQDAVQEMCETINNLVSNFGFDYVDSYLQSLNTENQTTLE